MTVKVTKKVGDIIGIDTDNELFAKQHIQGLGMTQSRSGPQRSGSKVKDCVLTITSFYTQHECHTLLYAAAL
eukprot:13901713-Ditylum_brightwellii.AAC.1